jgi:hypothetical protein
VDPRFGQHLPLADAFNQYSVPDGGPPFHVRVHPAVLLGAALFDRPHSAALFNRRLQFFRI